MQDSLLHQMRQETGYDYLLYVRAFLMVLFTNYRMGIQSKFRHSCHLRCEHFVFHFLNHLHSQLLIKMDFLFLSIILVALQIIIIIINVR